MPCSDGVDPAALDDAEESDDPQAAIVELLLGRVATVGTHDALRDELVGLKASALVRRAIAGGVDEAALTAVDDAGDTKSALIELVVQVEVSRG